MIKYTGRVQDTAGDALVSASILVSDHLTGLPAPLFQEDGTTALANPVTSDSKGLYAFKIEAGLYDLSISKDAYSEVEDLVTIMDDPSLLYLVADEALVSGDLVYVSGNASVSKCTTTDTEIKASVFAVCVESTLADGATGRFRLLGTVNRSGTPGALGYLGQDGQITQTIPDYDAGDLFSVIVGRQVSASRFLFKAPIAGGAIYPILPELSLIGWHGSIAGCASDPGSVSTDGAFCRGDLSYTFDNGVADTDSLVMSKVSGWSGGGTTVRFKFTKPDTTVHYGGSVTLDQLGLYVVEPIEVFGLDNSGVGAIGSSVFRAVVRGGSPEDVTVKSCGIIFHGINQYTPSPYNATFSRNSGQTIDVHAPGAVVAVNPDLTSSVGAFGSITYIDNLEFNFAGHITSPPGETWNALISPSPSRYIAVGGVAMGNGSCTLQIQP